MRAPRVCSTTGCPTIVTAGHCSTHARPTAYRRGYDTEHRRLRARWAPRVAEGNIRCRRCNDLIGATEQWDLGHPDNECPRPRAPEHAARCNRAAAGRAAHAE